MPGKKGTKLPNPVNYSLWLLNYGSKSIKKMKEALKKRGFSDETVTETIESLLDWGYLDDERHKESVVHKRKRNNPKGRSFVRQELYHDGINNLDNLEDLYTDEEEQEAISRLLGQWEKAHPLSSENKDKYFMRLARRGFSKGNILQVMEQHCENLDQDI